MAPMCLLVAWVILYHGTHPVVLLFQEATRWEQRDIVGDQIGTEINKIQPNLSAANKPNIIYISYANAVVTCEIKVLPNVVA